MDPNVAGPLSYERLPHPPMQNLREIGRLRVAMRDLDLLGPTDHEDDLEGFKGGLPPGPSREWWLRGSCGTEFVLIQDFFTESVMVAATEVAELEHVVAHLPFAVEFDWREAPRQDELERRAGAGGWVVYREDTHGTRFDVANLSAERSARCLAGLFEARGHKQFYAVERRTPLPPLPSPDSTPYLWTLVRVDDNGNRFVMKRGRYRGQLEFMARFFNREPRHKQHFFVEPTNE